MFSFSPLSHYLEKTVSSCAFLCILVFWQAVKTFTARFIFYLVVLGTVSDRKEISSSSIFGGRKWAVAIITVWQRLKIINSSIIVPCTLSCETYSNLACMSNLMNRIMNSSIIVPCTLSRMCVVQHFGMHVHLPNRTNSTLHSIYCFHFTSTIQYSRPICMGVTMARLSACYCKCPYRSPAHILSIT